MTLTQLEYAQKRMQQKWYDLVMAEQGGAAIQVLERMYNSYVLAMEEYNRCMEAYQHECQAEEQIAAVYGSEGMGNLRKGVLEKEHTRKAS